MGLEITPVTDAVGAEIGGVDLARLDDAEFQRIREAWNRHGFLLFRNQFLSDDDLLAFSRRFGELDPPPVQENGRMSPPGYPEIYVISNVKDDRGEAIGALGAGEAVWHTDMSYLEAPPDASSLIALEVPPRGGNTWFCGMQAAFAAMPAELKRAIAGRRIKHDGTYNSGGYLRQGVVASDDPLQAPGAWHPAVIVHPATGVPSLYLGRRRNSYIEGLSRQASDELLDRLWEFATQSRFTYEHAWSVGDYLIWDNRTTMHRRDPFDADQRRIMHRTQIKGSAKPRAYRAEALSV